MALKTYNVTVITPGAGSRKEQVEAVNANQARDYAEARFPGCKIGGVNTAY